MLEHRTSSRNITITVRVAAPLERYTRPEGKYRREFEQALQEHVRTLLDDLTIPCDIVLDTRLLDYSPSMPGLSYEIWINETLCRLPLRALGTEDSKPKELACGVYQGIHYSRELLVSLPLARSIRRKWAREPRSNCLSSLSDEQFQACLASLVCHGIKIDRAKEFFQIPGATEASRCSPRDLVEKILAGLDKVAITAYLGESQYRLINSGRPTEPGESGGEQSLNSMLEMMRDGLFYELGIVLPKVSFQQGNNLDGDSFQLQFNDLRFPAISGLSEGEFLVNDTVDRLALLKLSGRTAFNPANGSECAAIRELGSVQVCKEAGLTTWNLAGYFVLALSAAIRNNAGIFLNAEVVRFQLDQLGEAFPTLIEAVDSRIQLYDLTNFLRTLLEEGLCIRDLRGILEALLALASIKGKCNTLDWSTKGADAVRTALNRYVSNKYTRGGNTIVVILLEHAIEERLMQSLPLDEGEHHRLLDAVYRELGGLPPTAQSPLILTKVECRKKFRDLISREFPQVAVLCYQDLAPDMNIQPMGRISWNGSGGKVK